MNYDLISKISLSLSCSALYISTAELLARTSQANMADHMRRHRVRWLGHAARKPNDVMVKQLLLRTPSWATLGPWGAPTSWGWTPPWQPRPHAADRPSMRLGEPSTVPGRVEGGGQPVLSFEQCFILFSSFPLLLAFVVGGLGFEFRVFVAGWRHALRSE